MKNQEAMMMMTEEGQGEMEEESQRKNEGEKSRKGVRGGWEREIGSNVMPSTSNFP